MDEPRLPIKTFHCRYCSHLLIASTRALLSGSAPLPRRSTATRDRALILDIQGKRRRRAGRTTTTSENVASGGDTQGGAVAQENTENRNSTEVEKGRRGEGMVQAHYTIPLSTLIPDAKPVIVRREDGFEKRLLHRCGRCRVVVGYEIDNPLNMNPRELDHDRGEDGDQGEEEEGGDRVFYLLPGSLVGTEDLQHDTGEGGLDAIVERNEVLRGMEKEWEGW